MLIWLKMQKQGFYLSYHFIGLQCILHLKLESIYTQLTKSYNELILKGKLFICNAEL